MSIYQLFHEVTGSTSVPVNSRLIYVAKNVKIQTEVLMKQNGKKRVYWLLSEQLEAPQVLTALRSTTK